MISLWITIGLVISATAVASLGAYFSVVGIGALFSGAMLAVCLMAGSLEFAKFTLAAYLHQIWHDLNKLYRTYLVFAVVVLSVITSMGIFGFLSEAYQSASMVLEAENIKLENIKTQQKLITAEIARLNKSIDEIPANRISRRMKIRAEIEPAIKELNKKFEDGETVYTAANLKILDVKKKVGPLIYISQMFNMNIDVVVRYLVLTLVSVFDPLAICLVIAATQAIESRRQKKFIVQQNTQENTQENTQQNRPENISESIVPVQQVAPKPASVVAAEAQPQFQPQFKTQTQPQPQTQFQTQDQPRLQPELQTEPEPQTEDVIVQMNFKDENEDKKAI